MYLKTRWHKGPVVEGISPILVNFASLDDKALVWSTLSDGCKTPGVVVTKDLRSKSEKSETIKMRRKSKKRKKSNYHENCFHSSEEGGDDNVCSSHSEEDDFEKGDKALLVHGVESDWVEEEMMEDDIDFIKDVLEQKILKIFKNGGIKKKVEYC